MFTRPQSGQHRKYKSDMDPCPNGHSGPGNFRFVRNNRDRTMNRVCRTCRMAKDRAYKARKKAAAA